MKKVLLIYFIIYLQIGCVTVAPPSPMMTLGGPEVAPKGNSEVAIAVGTAAALFEGAHAGAQGYYGRYRYGLMDKWDIGGDMMGASRNDGIYLAIKSAARYRMTNNLRLELGLGVADDSDGKSINGDFAITCGTSRAAAWNFYGSLRWGYAHGFAGNAILGADTPNPEDTIVPPNTHYTILNVGTQGKISETQKFVFEGGYGYIFPNGFKSTPTFFLAVGFVATIGSVN